MGEQSVIATFFGDDEFPIEWERAKRELLWVHDDLHIPNPVSPMYADIGGWWLKCDYMFRRFGTPFASDWIVKIINGYVYTAAVPVTPGGLHAEAHEYGARYVRVPRPGQAGASSTCRRSVAVRPPHYRHAFRNCRVAATTAA